MKNRKLADIVDLIKRKLDGAMVFGKIRTMFQKEEKQDDVMIVEREEFARKMKKKFKGNRALLKAIEECMNRSVKKHEHISLTD